MLIGRSAVGKTTLCQRLNNEELKYHKTQTVQILYENMIDTPGEYLERGGFRGALMVTSADADLIFFVQDPTQGTMFPPLFNSMFTKPVIGIVTKADIATPRQIEDAKKYLQAAGAQKIVVISSVSGSGIEELVQLIDSYPGRDKPSLAK